MVKMETQKNWSKVCRSENLGSLGSGTYSSPLKAGSLQTKEEQMFQFKSEGKRKANVPI